MFSSTLKKVYMAARFGYILPSISMLITHKKKITGKTDSITVADWKLGEIPGKSPNIPTPHKKKKQTNKTKQNSGEKEGGNVIDQKLIKNWLMKLSWPMLIAGRVWKWSHFQTPSGDVLLSSDDKT